MIEAKMPWLRGREFKCEVDGARPNTGTNTVEELQAGGTGDGCVPLILTQLQTPLTLISTTLTSFLRSNITSVRFAVILQDVKK